MTIAYNGFIDLAGKSFGTLQVSQIARRTPALAWRYRCTRCGTEGVLPHTAFVNGSARCGNAGCGRVVPVSPRVANIVVPTPAVRSSDSASAREFLRSQKTNVTFTGEPSAEAMLNADSDTMRRYMDDKRRN